MSTCSTSSGVRTPPALYHGGHRPCTRGLGQTGEFIQRPVGVACTIQRHQHRALRLAGRRGRGPAPAARVISSARPWRQFKVRHGVAGVRPGLGKGRAAVGGTRRRGPEQPDVGGPAPARSHRHDQVERQLVQDSLIPLISPAAGVRMRFQVAQAAPPPRGPVTHRLNQRLPAPAEDHVADCAVPVCQDPDFAPQRVCEVREDFHEIGAGDAVLGNFAAQQRLEHLPVRGLDAPREAPDVRDRAPLSPIRRHDGSARALRRAERPAS